ncbi:MAG: glycosyltransferase [Anaerolineales bacterium]|nr:glycosyltransferase [Anaerolineae bacterium]MCB0206896.1 glycosyltransferase [Anaerolineae bacterium]MCB9143691.1 glycosyltransferase [Anaerolineales bacterium]
MADQNRRRAVVVTPTYDERETIADLIDAVLAEQDRVNAFELHVLVADSHSQDGTLEIVAGQEARDPRVHLLDVHERGIGIGLFRGFQHAIDTLGADVLIEMDADFQHNPDDIPHFLQKIDEGYDVVVGSRFVDGSINEMPFYRKVLSVGANQVVRSALGMKDVTEITTSYRAFTSETFLKVDPDSVPWQEKSFIFVPVFLVRMLETGARATEIPMTMHPRVRGYSKMIYWRYMRDILSFSLKYRLGMAGKHAG